MIKIQSQLQSSGTAAKRFVETRRSETIRRLNSYTLLVALALLSAACTANQTPSRVETALANMAKDVVIPIEAQKMKNPLPAGDQISKQGRQVYLQSCALCHGTDGHGRTTLGRAMYPPAMDLTSPHVQHWSDAELFWIIQNGVRLTGMPSWKSSVSATDMWKLAHFVHEMPRLSVMAASPSPGRKDQAHAETSPEDLVKFGKTLYRQEGCFMCHRLNAEGGDIGPDLTVEGTRGRTVEWLVGHFKDPPSYTRGSIMPAFKNLTDDQLNALTAFLESQKGPPAHDPR